MYMYNLRNKSIYACYERRAASERFLLSSKYSIYCIVFRRIIIDLQSQQDPVLPCKEQ